MDCDATRSGVDSFLSKNTTMYPPLTTTSGPPEPRAYYRIPSSSALRGALSGQQPRQQASSRPIKKTTLTDFVVACPSATAAPYVSSNVLLSNRRTDKTVSPSVPCSGIIDSRSNFGERYSSSPRPTPSSPKPKDIEVSSSVSLAITDDASIVLFTQIINESNNNPKSVPSQLPSDYPCQSIDGTGLENMQSVDVSESFSIHNELSLAAPPHQHERSLEGNSLSVPLGLEVARREDPHVSSRNMAHPTDNSCLIEACQVKEDTLHAANLQVKESVSASVEQQTLQAQLENLRRENDRLIEESNLQKQKILELSHKLEETGNLKGENDRIAENVAKSQRDLELAKVNLVKEAGLKVQVENQLEVCRREKEALSKDQESSKEELERVRDKFKVFRTAATSSLQAKDVLTSNLQKSLLDANKTVDEFRSTQNQLSAANKKYRQQERSLRLEIEDLKADKENFETQVTTLEKQIRNLERQKQDLQTQLGQARWKQTDTHDKLVLTRRKYEVKKEEYERADEQLDKSEKKIQSLTEDNQTLQKSLKKSQAKLKESQSSMQDLKERFRRIQRSLLQSLRDHTVAQQELLESTNVRNEIHSELQTSQAWNRSYRDKITELESRIERGNQKKKDLKSELQSLQISEVRFKLEAALLRKQNKTLERQLHRAQRHISSFDQMSSFQHEIRSGSDYESIRRCKNYSPSSQGSQVIKLVKRLNDATYQFAKYFVSKHNTHFFKTRPSAPTKRAKAILGEPILAILQGHASKREYSEVRVLLEAVCRMFLVAWCWGIIEGWYPKRQNFLDLLVKFNEPDADSQQVQVLSRRKTPIITKSTNADYHVWIDDILGDLSALLKIGGIGILPLSYEGMSKHLLPILKDAYTIRTALAEKDIYGNLEMYLVTFRTSFQPNCMVADYIAYDTLKETPNLRDWREEYVIGNVALGLEVNESREEDDDLTTTTRVVLNPEVIVSSFEITHDKPKYFLLDQQ